MGLSSDLFWSLDHREFDALKRQWAFARAEMLNLQANTDGVPFTIEDIMDPESRAERVEAIKAAEAVAEMEAQIENFQLGQYKVRGDADETGVPAAFLAMGKRHKERNGRR